MTGALVLARLIHTASLVLLVGVAAFRFQMARGPGLGPEAHSDPAGAALDRQLRRLTAWSYSTGLGSALLWLVIQAAVMSGEPLHRALAASVLWTVLARTTFGCVWTLRLAGLAVLGGALLWEARRPTAWRARAACLATLLIGAGALMGLAWVGHAAAVEGGVRPLHLLGACLHLLAGGVWLGGLLPLALLLRSASRGGGPRWEAEARATVRRFSRLALACVGILLGTGLVHAGLLVGSLPALVGTPYGRLLLTKLLLTLAILAVAAQNRLRLVPLVLTPRPSPEQAGTLARLGRNVLVETAAGFGVLLLVALLGVTPPSVDSAQSAPPSAPQAQTRTQGEAPTLSALAFEKRPASAAR